MINTKTLIWKDLNTLNTIPASTLTWIDDNQSLTAKLKQKFINVSVNVLSQTKVQPHENEILLLNWQGQFIIREVEILADKKAVVFARSIIPISTDTKNLLNIGSKMLGEVLFNDINIKRSHLQITQASDNTWGRRSTFTIGISKLLVSEFFLKNLYK